MKKLILFFLLFTTALFSHEFDLSRYEKPIYSQQGEDGIIHILLQLTGQDSQYYVEFGAMNGHHLSNTKNLREHHGWKGLLLDADYQDDSINLQKAHVTAENINDLFAKYNVPYNLDVLSIDIDFNDFYVWQAISEKYRPRIVIIEYNASHLPH